MILIADSGSTKTDWSLVDKGQLVQQVLHEKERILSFQSEEEISTEIGEVFCPNWVTAP